MDYAKEYDRMAEQSNAQQSTIEGLESDNLDLTEQVDCSSIVIDYIESRLKKSTVKLATALSDRADLIEFVENFIDAWENGMGGDGYILRDANEVLAKVRNKK